MTAERDTTRIVRSWLHEDEHESAERVLLTVLDRLDTTPQRRAIWPVWRATHVNLYAKLGVGLVAALVVVFVGLRLLPTSSFGPGGPTPTPTVAPTPTPSPAPTAAPRPTPKPRVVPKAGALAIGRHDLNLEGVNLTFEIATEGWVSNGIFGFDKKAGDALSAGFIVWEDDADGVFSDPCGQVMAPAVGATASDMLQAIATIPGITVVEPETVQVIANVEARRIVIRLPDPLPCPNDQFYLWYDETIAGNARYASAAGNTMRIWIFDYEGKRLQLDGETYAGAEAALGDEVDDIVRSINFD